MTLTTDRQSVVGSPTARNWSRLRRVISGGLALVGAGISAWLPVHADQNPPGCLLNNYSIGVLVDKVDAHVGDTLSYSVDIRNLESNIKPTCLASDITLSLVTPDRRTNVVTLRRTSLVPGQTDFYPNVATYVVRSQDLVPNVPVPA